MVESFTEVMNTPSPQAQKAQRLTSRIEKEIHTETRDGCFIRGPPSGVPEKSFTVRVARAALC